MPAIASNGTVRIGATLNLQRRTDFQKSFLYYFWRLRGRFECVNEVGLHCRFEIMWVQLILHDFKPALNVNLGLVRVKQVTQCFPIPISEGFWALHLITIMQFSSFFKFYFTNEKHREDGGIVNQQLNDENRIDFGWGSSLLLTSD